MCKQRENKYGLTPASKNSWSCSRFVDISPPGRTLTTLGGAKESMLISSTSSDEPLCVSFTLKTAWNLYHTMNINNYFYRR